MKQSMYVLALTAALMVSCSDKDTDTYTASEGASSGGEKTISFCVTNYEQIDMDDLATRSTEVSNLSYLTLGVYNATTLELVEDAITQEKSDTDYGNFSLTLPYGDYVLLFLGYTNTYYPDMTNPKAIVFDDNFVPHLFYKELELTVDAASSETQTIELKRVVAAFRVVISDAVPEGLDYVEYFTEGGSYILNSLTGYADEVVTRTSRVHFSESDAGKTNQSMTVYAFLTDETASMTFTCTAYHADGDAMVTHKFTNVPMKINQLTVYTGNFFTIEQGEGGFSVTLGDDYSWENREDFEFSFSDY